jgi:hypothetical protein
MSLSELLMHNGYCYTRNGTDILIWPYEVATLRVFADEFGFSFVEQGDGSCLVV